MIWQVPHIWDEGEVWILGGGPSVTKQFEIPNSLVQEVVNGAKPPSAYSPYMSRIHKKHVIGKMAMTLKQASFTGREIADFIEYWSVKLPGSKSFCIYPQDERQHEI